MWIVTFARHLSDSACIRWKQNENYETLEKLITSAKDKHMPSTLEKVKRYKHKLSPWITTAIIKSIKFRDNLYRKMKSSTLNPELYRTNYTGRSLKGAEN